MLRSCLAAPAAAYAPWAALLLRASLGGMMLLHGVGKAFVVGLDEVIVGFVADGFPPWTAYASTVVEIVAGALLLVGYQTRLAAVALLPVVAGILVYHLPNGWVFHAPGGGWEYPQLILEAVLATVLLGGGAYSVDARRR